ncbi:MAG: plasmid stability protein [Candidatus Binatia bacterium]|jgi:plasmid stability protein
MKNITVSLEDDLYRKARVAAAETDSSVTALVREFLTTLTAEGNRATEVGKDSSAILETIEKIRKRHPGFDPSNRLSRDEVHAR